MRPVLVTLKKNIIASDGSISVAAQSVGTVVETQYPPTAKGFYVTFQRSGGNVSVWLPPEDLIWRDGILGPLRAILQTQSAVIVDAEFVNLISSVDLVVDDRLSFAGNSIDLRTDDGFSIRITSDANSDLRVEYLKT